MTESKTLVIRHDRFEARALRPCDVARMWQCSERHVRSLIAKGDLRSFRVGGKLVRIPVDAITEYEQGRQIAACPSSAQERATRCSNVAKE